MKFSENDLPVYVREEDGSVRKARDSTDYMDCLRDGARSKLLLDDLGSGIIVSTVFVGIPVPNEKSDCNLFETMVWLEAVRYGNMIALGSDGEYRFVYETEADARAMHAKIITHLIEHRTLEGFDSTQGGD